MARLVVKDGKVKGHVSYLQSKADETKGLVQNPNSLRVNTMSPKFS
jgi:hypothetical protein